MADIIYERVLDSFNYQEMLDEYNSLSDPIEKHALEWELTELIESNAILVIDKLTDSEFKRLKRENKREFEKFATDFGLKYFDNKIRSGETTLEGIDNELIRGQIVYDYLERKPRAAVKRILSKKKTLERLWILSKMESISFKVHVGARLYQMDPYFRINDLIKRRFNFDENWNYAISILATHENLVKMKLVKLGMHTKEIKTISKTSGLESLIEKLVELIEKKEKRTLSLSFYKISALRKVRNRLEHDGYLQKVTEKEALELVKDIENFEKELFPEIKK